MRLRRGWSREELAQRSDLPLDVIVAYESDPASLSSQTALRILDGMPLGLIDENLADPPASLSPSLPPQWLLAEMDARMFEIEAALRIDQGRFREALEALDRALSMSPCQERSGRLLLSKAPVLGELNREERALEALREAEHCLDPVQEPKLWLRLRLEQMYFFCQTGRYGEAEARLAETRELAARVGRDRERLQVRFLEGWIARGSGRTAQAVQTLQPVREELLAARRMFDATAVGLDLAGLLVSEGRLTEVQELARQLEPMTQAKGIPFLARATLKVFCRMAGSDGLKAERVHRLAAEFRKAGGRLTRPYEIPG
jgi:tetratricopeptide (TPR) repeat protein